MRLEVIEKHSGKVFFKHYYHNFTSLNLAIRKYKRNYSPDNFEFKIIPLDAEITRDENSDTTKLI